MKPDFDKMNETDVREIIVRPLLTRLGYAHGTDANIRTEVPLRYAKAFLGRKKPNDPPLAGRADYVCDATSYGRWTVEVKRPSQQLSRDDVEQAHTYSAHPEIAAVYFLLTNGRDFQLYATGKLDAPVMTWRHEETDDKLMTLYNILSYSAIKKLTAITTPDINKPLGEGLASKLKIVGGQVRYGEHKCDFPLLNMNEMKGKIGAVTGVGVTRDEDGRIHAVVTVLSPYQDLAELNKLAGLEDYHFFSSNEYLSSSVDQPTIFQNVVHVRVEPGTVAKIGPGQAFQLPFGFKCTAITEAAGYVSDDIFKGAISIDYHYDVIRGARPINPRMAAIMAQIPATFKLAGEGTFDVNFSAIK